MFAGLNGMLLIYLTVFSFTSRNLLILGASNNDLTTDGALIDADNKSSNESSDEFSYIYQIQIELKTPRIDDPTPLLERRLTKLVQTAFMIAVYKHRKQVPPADLSFTESEYSTKLLKRRVSEENKTTTLYFVTFANGKLVTGEVVADDLKDLSSSQISAILHYPLTRVFSYQDIENASNMKWWMILGILGIGAILLVIGWFMLFLYYNSCGYENGIEPGDSITRAQRAQIPKGIIINPSPPWTKGVYDHPLGEPWADPGAIEASNGDNGSKSKRKEPRYKRSFRTLSEARLEKQIEQSRISQEDREMSAKLKETLEKVRASRDIDVTTSSSIVTESDQSEIENQQKKAVKSVKKNTKIAPVTVEIVKEEHNVVRKEPKLIESQLKIPDAKRKKRKEITLEVKSSPESEFGSTTNDEDITEKSKLNVSKSQSRPMTAGRERTPLFDKGIIQPIKSTPKIWTCYAAGDNTAKFWNKNSSENYPAPASPTAEGIIEVRSGSKRF